MTTHGGARSGAGRPKGGVSQLRRIMQAAITKGLADAGREKYGDLMPEDDREAAVVTGSMIVQDMINAGKGDDVLKLAAVIQSKDTGESDGESTLEAALKRLPTASRDTFMSSGEGEQGQKTTQSGSYGESATDTESGAHVFTPDGGSFFSPQQALLMHSEPTTANPTGDRQAPPTPPGATPDSHMGLDLKNFEKSGMNEDPVFDVPADDDARSR